MAPYPVLNNRPIDQWKVTELKEELKRRRLRVNGLKEDLIKRLDEALRSEMALADDVEADDVSVLNETNALKDSAVNDEKAVEVPASNEDSICEAPAVNDEKAGEDQSHSEKVCNVLSVDVKDDLESAEEGKVHASLHVNSDKEYKALSDDQERNEIPLTSATKAEDPLVNELSAMAADTSTDPVPFDSSTGRAEHRIDAIANEHTEVDVRIKTQDASGIALSFQSSNANIVTGADQPEKTDLVHAPTHALQQDSGVMDTAVIVSSSESDGVSVGVDHNDHNLVCDASYKDSKPANDDNEPILSELNNQVSQVIPDLGSQIKCTSFSTDYMPTNENNNSKGDLNDGNFDLKLEIKTEMVQPSSDFSHLGADLKPKNDDKDLVKSQSSLEEIDCTTANTELSKKTYIAGSGSPEKLHLDRSSGDESMDEDLEESKPVDLAFRPDEPLKSTEVNREDSLMDGALDDASIKNSFADSVNVVDEVKIKPTALSEKRKPEGQEVATNNEAVKRQRRWNTEASKATEKQTYTAPSTMPNVFQPTLKRSFGTSGSSPSLDVSKERIVPASSKPATTSLRIDNFVRPFTLKAAQELLAKTGSVLSFWMDHIKTHCYVTYNSVDEAVETRNAVYNLQWPPNGGKLLVAEFVDPQEVKARLEQPSSAVPVSPVPITTPRTPFQPNQQNYQTLPQHLPLPPPPPLLRPPHPDILPAKETLPPPPPLKKPEPPVLTLDDLFKKTKASPRIYYLPISKEEVDARVAAQYLAYK